MIDVKPWGEATALSGATYSAIELAADGTRAFILDQLELPEREDYLTVESSASVGAAIEKMVIRGAPAIGVAGAYGMVLSAHEARALAGSAYLAFMADAAGSLVRRRPTAVNLAWAVQRCLAVATQHAHEAGSRRHAELAEFARQIHRDDVASCRAIGGFGAESLRVHARDGVIRILTHCNAGALATGGYGTALGVIRALRDLGLEVRVLADETRPYLQGARLTAWELARDGFDVTVIGDAMAAHAMRRGAVDAVIVGADRIARNGDVANKIGTYGLACLAHAHRIPFHVAAPWSTVDLDTASGALIPIEERAREELSELAGRRLVPAEAKVYNPSFDVTPAALVASIVTERGVFAPSALVNSSP
ncbi:MAG: S-methyl-5-thioribose-1-phosphate isomerase [Deltaproteobacteria bacterium]|nr:S-methyl-5-thioribose-1-phosphate isomerase [Deltaproteobacteria bacterium]